MLRLQFIECVLLALYGLALALRFNKKRLFYARFTVILLMLNQIYTIIILLNGSGGIGLTERLADTYLPDIIFALVIVMMYLYRHTTRESMKNALTITVKVSGAVLCAVCSVYLVYSIGLVQKYFNSIEQSSENVYVLRSSADENMVITADMQEGALGSHLYYSMYTGNNNQKFEFLDMGEKQYKILLANTDQAFDLSNGDMNEGAGVNTWEMYDTTTQLWEIEEAGGCVTLTSVHSGLTIAYRQAMDNDIRVYMKSDSADEKYILSRTISDQSITALTAGYKDTRIFNISIYYIYVVVLCLGGIAIFVYSYKRK